MEKAILVGVNLNSKENIEYSMEELENLSEAANINPVGSIVQNLERPTPNFYVGRGKVNEIKNACELHDATLVIFNDELSPAHIRNLEEVLECKVIDRTILILDIFASRAKTKEAMLQVEIAQLKYMLPRLIGLTKSLNRQQGGIGLKGPGEKKLELDRRRIESQISKLNKELKEVVKNRETNRQRRKKENIKVVSLVGYTNAGKSSLMNSILNYSNLDKTVLEKDMLFATLETSTRKIKTKNNHQFLLTDTVGFVSKLPHHLINAFKSTLEEVCEADLLVHVVDVTNENYPKQIEVSESVLKSIGVEDIPIIYAYNKIDLLEDDFITEKNGVNISAKKNININTLINTIEENIFSLKVVELIIPFESGHIHPILKGTVNILEEEFKENGIYIKASLTDLQCKRYQKFINKWCD